MDHLAWLGTAVHVRTGTKRVHFEAYLDSTSKVKGKTKPKKICIEKPDIRLGIDLLVLSTSFLCTGIVFE